MSVMHFAGADRVVGERCGRRGLPALGRQFLFLQGPHGPFFAMLARALRKDGASVLKAGLCRADDTEWRGVGPYQPYSGDFAGWRDWLERLVSERQITDIVLYGDTRPYHAVAVDLARETDLTVHVFEEGYLRPFWVTYERGGSNGNSRLMDIDLETMSAATTIEEYEQEEAPPHWGAAWRHAYWGLRHHFDVVFRNRAYPSFREHRPTNAVSELGFYLKRLLVLPLLTPERRWREKRLLRSGKIYHLVLLQMAIDASMRDHSDYDSVPEFIEECLKAFAEGAPKDHYIVFKSHPFEDGRERLEFQARAMARDLGLEDRMIFLHGGKLGALLDRARSAITINSTAGQQALWRGLPISVLGQCVYAKPEFVKQGDLGDFFAGPEAPDATAYRDYRQFLLMSSQVRGSYYTGPGRRNAVEQIAPKMLDHLDPYDRALQVGAALEEGANIAHFPRRAG
ncbi:MAG: capsule biosynthesis protein CapA [Pseudomonadota bacterium]